MAKVSQVILSASLVLLVMIGASGISRAHELEQDTGISGVLHIPPVDEPKAGQQTQLFVSFGDKLDRFNLTDCNCTMTFEKGGKTLQTVPLRPQIAGATLASVTDYEFPSAGDYGISVKGHATNEQFPDFSLPYDVTVENSAENGALSTKKNNSSSVGLLGVGAIALIGVFCYAGIKDGGRYRQQPLTKNTDKRINPKS